MDSGISFLQSVPWEQFQQALGRATYWLDGTLFIRHPLRFGAAYWYAPRARQAPTIDRLDGVFGGQAKFLLLEPAVTALAEPWRACPTRQPRQTLLTDLLQPTDKLEARLKSKTRYNIGLAKRKGVQIIHVPNDEVGRYWPAFWQLTEETNRRHQIKSHPESYYRALFASLVPANMASLHIAQVDGQPVSALVLIRHEKTATYLFGASSSNERSTMASYLLQWQTMLWAQEQGDAVYDWWGIRVDTEMGVGTLTDETLTSQIMPAPGKSYGVTRFKLGFGGHIHLYPSAYVRSYSGFWYNAWRWRSHPGSFSY